MSFNVEVTPSNQQPDNAVVVKMGLEEDDQPCVVPEIHRAFTTVGCIVPSVLSCLIFVILWSVNTTLLTTGMFLCLLSLTLLAAALMFIDMDMDISANQSYVRKDNGSNNNNASSGSNATGQNSCCGRTVTLHWFAIIWNVILSLIFAISTVVMCVGAAREWRLYMVDFILASIVSLVASFACVIVIRGVISSWNTSNPRMQTTGCWTCCCALCGMPMVVLCTLVVLWNTTMDVHTMGFAVPGVLVSTSNGDGPTLHLYCTDGDSYNSSLPTVLFLHGYGGSSLDAESVRKSSNFVASGARMCSIDRPGNGWSEGYLIQDENSRHFGKIAQLTLEVLQKEKITGDLVLMFHSLGAYHALALAAEISQEKDDLWKVRGMLAVDAMVPNWSTFEKRRESCSTKAALENSYWTWFWSAVRTVAPSGLPRMIYVTGYGGYFNSMNLYPTQYTNILLNLNMRRKYFDTRVVEGRRMGINCGYAKNGQETLKQQPRGAYVRLEVLVAINGINITQFSQIASNSTNVNVELIDLSEEYSKEVSQHQALMLSQKASTDYVVPAVLRILESVALQGAGEL